MRKDYTISIETSDDYPEKELTAQQFGHLFHKATVYFNERRVKKNPKPYILSISIRKCTAVEEAITKLTEVLNEATNKKIVELSDSLKNASISLQSDTFNRPGGWDE